MPAAVLEPAQSPLAVQLVGLLVAVHVRVELPPVVAVIGFADKATTGAGGTDTVSGTLTAEPVPLALVQVRL